MLKARCSRLPCRNMAVTSRYQSPSTLIAASDERAVPEELATWAADARALVHRHEVDERR